MSAEPIEVNVYETKTHMSRLLAQVEEGQEFIVKRADKPIARLIPFVARIPERPFGLFAGEIVIGDDFDDPLPEETSRAFGGLAP
jgi:antitoxin (DNA-binding transcriptional repressor) of toxin-antitoxin stability system